MTSEHYQLDGRDITTAITNLYRTIDEARALAEEAAGRLRELLDIPGRRPDAWEAAPVESLRGELTGVLRLLDRRGVDEAML
jgi:hypothetical protein